MQKVNLYPPIWIEWMIILINYAVIHSKMSKTVLISGQSARMDHTPWQTNEHV